MYIRIAGRTLGDYLTFEQEQSGLFFFSLLIFAISKKLRHPTTRQQSSSML